MNPFIKLYMACLGYDIIDDAFGLKTLIAGRVCIEFRSQFSRDDELQENLTIMRLVAMLHSSMKTEVSHLN